MRWANIDGYPYQISNDGRVRRTTGWSKGRVLKPQFDAYGYERVTLHNGTKTRQTNIHRLVCEAFHGGPPTCKHEVLHKNGDRKDNRATNLRWGTRKQNRQDARIHNTMARGVKHPSAKLSEKDIRTIRARHAKERSLMSIAIDYGLSRVHVHNIVKRKAWSHVK